MVSSLRISWGRGRGNMELFIFVVVISIIVFFLFKNKRNRELEPALRQKPYAAVKIDECDFPCSAAFNYSSRVYLVHEAPTLPLDNCDKTEKCRCRFMHYSDRRHSVEDRRSSSLILRDTFTGDDKRTSPIRGRRIDD